MCELFAIKLFVLSIIKNRKFIPHKSSAIIFRDPPHSNIFISFTSLSIEKQLKGIFAYFYIKDMLYGFGNFSKCNLDIQQLIFSLSYSN